MGQKSLSMLHRADCSMIWNSFLFDKSNKWLSYNLWFIYIQFYKVLFFLDFTIKKNIKLLNYYKKSYYISSVMKKKKFKLKKTRVRFSYYIDLYCIEFLNQLILLNLYFLTNLAFYKKKKMFKNKKDLKAIFGNDVEKDQITNRQYNPTYLQKKNNLLYSNFF